ncbi:MAG: thiamine diphosphokinase [Nitriliruptor sp.]|nr:MAG: thiamine diphosphokinase [Nitriliruptor sp.]
MPGDQPHAPDEGSDGLRQVVVLAGGDPVQLPLPRPLPHPIDLVIAADGGYDAAATLAVPVDVLVGDLDSVSPDGLATARAAGTRIERHPVDKDRTDLALALDAVVADGPAEVLLIGGHGGRLDHLLANVALLAAPEYGTLRISALLGEAVVTVLRDRRARLLGRPGELVSLLAMHGPAHGVTTTGLRFPLDHATLPVGSSLGVSNEFTGSHATVAVTDGVLVAVQPGGPDRIEPAPH